MDDPASRKYDYAFAPVWDANFTDCTWKVSSCLDPLPASEDCVIYDCPAGKEASTPFCSLVRNDRLTEARLYRVHTCSTYLRLPRGNTRDMDGRTLVARGSKQTS